ncbi:MAG: hypothetical protein HKN91_08125 [Acidimicrobiia bacterium]|nr:hypothetical protein [Acidimicrobiia bacterium]
MNDGDLRYAIYRAFADTGRPPTKPKLAKWCGDSATAQDALWRLHNAHAIVLDSAGDIRMALPFSAVETGHTVASGDRSWLANCAWDTLAIPAALDVDATIDATWLDTGDPVDLAVVDRDLSSTAGFIHFAVPARQWWDDIVET